MSKSNVAMNVSSHEESEEQLNPATLDLLDHVARYWLMNTLGLLKRREKKMKAAIYARYSSDNQREQSIEDQVRVCRIYAQKQGIEVLNEHIYADEARSGSIRDRKGLDALMKSCEEKRFDIVLVDDSSRISRDVYYFNQLLCRFIYLHVRLISISDDLDTQEENAKVGYQFRSIFNELYLTDLKKKTHRGQMGQVMRGFMNKSENSS